MLDKYSVKYSDPFDWETAGISTTPGKSRFRKKLSRIVTGLFFVVFNSLAIFSIRGR
jgi:hypothetical protein